MSNTKFVYELDDERFGGGVVLAAVDEQISDGVGGGIFGILKEFSFLVEVDFLSDLCFLIKHNSFIVETIIEYKKNNPNIIIFDLL